MGRIDKPWGYEDQILITQMQMGDKTGMLGVRRLVINGDEMTSYSSHSVQTDIVYLQEGSVVVRLEDGMKDLSGEDALVIRPEQKHQLQNIDSNVAEVLEISFPYKPKDIDRIEDPYRDTRNSQ
jgi:Cupin domain.